MATIQERLQMKRVPIDKWSTREQLCLASAVMRSGDQNWMSVSRALKPFAEPNRPPDWFSQKNCAAQYGSMLENVETPKRKKRTSGAESAVETPGESILRKLTQERKAELKRLMEDERREYLKLKEEMEAIKSGKLTEAQVARMCQEIDEEERRKEADAASHAQWLRAREERKLEVERAFRPPTVGHKRKASDSECADAAADEPAAAVAAAADEPAKLALSPLLTSLLKTPAHASSVTSILHSAITNQRGASPTIASLLNSAAPVPVSAGLQQLVTTAIGQEREAGAPPPMAKAGTPKSEDKDESMDSGELTASETKEHDEPDEDDDDEEEDEDEAEDDDEDDDDDDDDEEETEEQQEESGGRRDAGAENRRPGSPEQAVKAEPAEEEEAPAPAAVKAETPDEPAEQPSPRHQFLFDSDSGSKTDGSAPPKEPEPTEPPANLKPDVKREPEEDTPEPPADVKKEPEPDKEFTPGSVEIVEVVVMEDEDSDKEKSAELKAEAMDACKDRDAISETIYSKEAKVEPKAAATATSVYDEYDFDDKERETDADGRLEERGDELPEPPEPKQEDKDEERAAEKTVATGGDGLVEPEPDEPSRQATFTPEYSEAYFDDVPVMDKPGRAKRDYSRTKKKEDKDLDILLAVEKAVSAGLEDADGAEETGSDKDSQDSDKKSDGGKKPAKDSTERSNSPWTEEEEAPFTRTRRRISTPATPVDSVPNSPASSTQLDDDRDYRTWKKSVMLVYSRLAAHKYASLFLKPITDDQAPGYHGLVYRPMDLQTIRRNVEAGHTRTTLEFQRDVLLMFHNAIMYNKSNDHVYNMARQMQLEGQQQIQLLLQVQTQLEAPARRETRTSESGLKRKRGQDDALRSKKRRDD